MLSPTALELPPWLMAVATDVSGSEPQPQAPSLHASEEHDCHWQLVLGI